jgi:hypothetical protein
MKTFATLLLLLSIFNGCSSKNAFDKFQFSQTRELSEDTLISQKIVKEGRVEGVASVIYLNKVLPKEYYDKEYFYIYLYIKQKDANVSFLLNKTPSQTVQKLDFQNKFTYLTSFDANWSQYYLVTFKKSQSNRLHLKIQTDKGAKADFVFVKDK